MKQVYKSHWILFFDMRLTIFRSHLDNIGVYVRVKFSRNQSDIFNYELIGQIIQSQEILRKSEQVIDFFVSFWMYLNHRFAL